MSDNYIMTVRAADPSGKFGEEVADEATFLSVPQASTNFDMTNQIQRDVWYQQVRDASRWKNDKGDDRGDILFIVHGYNISTAEALQRHNLLRNDLTGLGFRGVIVSFDRPTHNEALAYLPDRHDAKLTA
jgi:esterase/lipase superfamily enzyme